jgi:arginine decarboxylase
MNYTLQEYANDVVYHVQTVCDEAGVRHPAIVSESGRAVSAYHSMLIFNVLGTAGFGEETIPTKVQEDFEQPLVDLIEAYHGVTQRNALETYHDAQQALDMAMNLFSGGYLSLEQRSHAENLFWAICEKIHKLTQGQADVPEDLQALEELLSDTYFCNFSLFQSIPDSWAIKQLFPVMPIHRLMERPVNHAVIGDITCDSDGKMDQFIDRRDVKKTILLHKFNGEPYYLGVFLVGAYQEILGDLHNLLGDTHAVHVTLPEGADESGEGARVAHIIKGDSVNEVLKYVEFDPEVLMAKLRRDAEAAVHAGRLEDQQAGRLLKFYEEALMGYTYLEDPNVD